MLAGRGASGRKNIFWMTVNKILEKDSKDMMIAFMKLIFKVDLQNIKEKFEGCNACSGFRKYPVKLQYCAPSEGENTCRYIKEYV